MTNNGVNARSEKERGKREAMEEHSAWYSNPFSQNKRGKRKAGTKGMKGET